MSTKLLVRFAPFLVLIAAMLWATDAPFRVYLTRDLSSTFIVLGEHFVALFFVAPLLISQWRTLKLLTFKEWLAVLFIAICGSALASVSFTEAFRYVNPSVAILLQKLQPLIAIGLSAVVLRERLASRFWLWAVLAIGGAYLISFPNLIPQTFEGETFNLHTLGVVFALLAALFWGASTVFGRLVLGKINFKVMTGLRFVFAFVFLLILAVSQQAFPAPGVLTGTDMLFIAIIALVSGVFSLLLYYKGLQHTRASVATIAELGFPLAAVVINWVVLGAALTAVQLFGMAVLLFAVYKLADYNRSDGTA